MPIQDLQKDLQKKESENFGREHNKTVYNVWNSKENTNTDKKNAFDGKKDKIVNKNKKAIIVGGIIILGIFLLMIAIMAVAFFQKGFFSQERVNIELNSPTSINSNSVTEILFVYTNDNRSNLYNSKIIVNFGDYFIPIKNQDNLVMASEKKGVIDIGEIDGGESNKVIITGYFAGPVNSSNTISGTLKYSPEKTEVIYETSNNTTTAIASSPITIKIDLPNEIVSGNLVDSVVSISNDSDSEISNLKLMLELGDGFNIHKTSPLATNETTWLIDKIEANSEYIVNIQGNVNANVGTSQLFIVEVGTQEGESEYVVYATERRAPKIIDSPISISQKLVEDKDNVVFAGEKLQYLVNFQNNSKQPLRDAIIIVSFDTDILDFAKLELFDSGDYDAEKKEIIWKASDVPELKTLNPNDSGIVKFDVPVLENFPIETIDDKNFSIVTLAAIDSNDIPSELRVNKTVLSNVLALPVGAKVIFKSDKEYLNGEKQPTVNKKTTYKINFSIDSINNNIVDAIVKAKLPTHIKFEGGDDVEFNERTNEVTWNVGSVPSGAGITSEKINTEFDISIIPSIDQLDEEPILIKEQYLYATDEFADIEIAEVGEILTTQYLEGSDNYGIVIK